MNNNPFKLEQVSIRLVTASPLYSEVKIDNPKKAISLIGEELRAMDREVMCILNLQSDGRPINFHFASIGSLNNAIASPRDMLKSSILSNAASVILIHNHPSGSLTPSKEDTNCTIRLKEVCKYVDIPLLDHIIIGPGSTSYFSFRENNLFE